MSELLKFLEADKLRTQGEWKNVQFQFYSEPHPIDWYYGIQAWEDGKYKTTVIDEEGTDLTNYPNAINDTHFIAQASRIAPDLQQLVRDMKVMVKALNWIEVTAGAGQHYGVKYTTLRGIEACATKALTTATKHADLFKTMGDGE